MRGTSDRKKDNYDGKSEHIYGLWSSRVCSASFLNETSPHQTRLRTTYMSSMQLACDESLGVQGQQVVAENI